MPDQTETSELEKLVHRHGSVSIQHTPYDAHPWTVTVLRSRWLEPGTGHPTERVEWWDHAHDESVEKAAAHLLRELAAAAADARSDA